MTGTEHTNTESDTELRERLTPEQYAVTQQAGTERAFTGEYWDCHDDGTYRCIVCDVAAVHLRHEVRVGVGLAVVLRHRRPRRRRRSTPTPATG